MTDEHLRELKKQTAMMAGREAFKSCVAILWVSLIGTFMLAIKFPDVPVITSPWFILGAPLALGLLAYWAVYVDRTRD